MLRQREFCWVMTFVCTLAALTPRSVLAYEPESPEVERLVQQAVGYIEKNAKDDDRFYKMLGGACLAAMAAHKATGNDNHPLVQAAIAKCRAAAKGNEFHSGEGENYSLGLALIFLCELDPIQYRSEAQFLLSQLLKRQQSGGGWGYAHGSVGDISQTQYAALGLWIAGRSDLQVPNDAVERLANFLIRVQDPRGGYGYQVNDPGSYTRIPQQGAGNRPPGLSMGAAGTGSIYICAELLGFIDPKELVATSRLPPAIKIVKAEKRADSNVDLALFKKAAQDGDNWFAANFKINQGEHQAYYLYSTERYQSFRELASGGLQKSPAWYNGGVEFLARTQKKDGSWDLPPDGRYYSPLMQTSFATLFLLRSAKKSITRLVIEKGRLTGGKGLGPDMSTAKVDAKGKVVTSDGTKAVSDLLAMLDDPKAPQDEYVSDVPEKLVLSAEPKERALQLARVRRMIINGSFQARLTAARTLGTIRDLDSAPYLIFALSDPDHRVVRAARDSLRFMSRKADGFGFTIAGDKAPEKHEWREAQKNWTEWLLSVKPDAELLE